MESVNVVSSPLYTAAHRVSVSSQNDAASPTVLERISLISLKSLGLVRYKLVISTLPIVALAMITRAICEECFGFYGLILDSVIANYTWPCMLAIGVLLQGVMEDYKEAERIPGHMASIFDSLAERVMFLQLCHARASAEAETPQAEMPFDARAMHLQLLELITAYFEYFAEMRGSSEVLALSSSTGLFLVDRAINIPGGDSISWEIWSSIEQLRNAITRSAVIKRTDFLPAGGLLTKFVTYSVVILYVLAIYTQNSDETGDVVYYGTVYITIATNTILFSYLLFLTEDLDNPFEHSVNCFLPNLSLMTSSSASLSSNDAQTDEIEVFPLLEVYARLSAYAHPDLASKSPPLSAIAALLSSSLLATGKPIAPASLASQVDERIAEFSPQVDERRVYRQQLVKAMRAVLTTSAVGGEVAETVPSALPRSISWRGKEKSVSSLRKIADFILCRKR
jgi:hypothetical protein